MPHSHTTKTRLPYWTLLFLALILSGGGFFCYTSFKQQTYSQLDNRLFDAADLILNNQAQATAGSYAIDDLCQQMAGVATSTPLELALYSKQGTLNCSTGSPWAESLTNGNKTVKLAPDTQLLNNQSFRTLSLPVNRTGTLAARISTSQADRQLTLLATGLFLGGIVLLTFFTLLQRRQRCKNLATIRRMSRLIERTDVDGTIAELVVAPNATPEAKKLADNYNGLVRKLTDDLRRSRQFAANVTHELRTPLTILRGETELALRNNRSREQLQQILESNLEEVSRMSYLIEDLLLLSKSDLGEIPLKMESLDLTGLTMELHHQGQLLATPKKIAVALDIPEEQIVVQADSLRLRQVLLNLITNAIKYTPDDGKVSIALKQDKDQVRMTICDSGIGMTAEHLDKIFERFYRVDKTRNRNDGGSGLGLAIVKWIVDAHKGQVTVKSTPGQGSCFSVSVPINQETDTKNAS